MLRGIRMLEADQAGFKSNCTFTCCGIFRQITPMLCPMGPLSVDTRMWPLPTLYPVSFSPRKRKIWKLLLNTKKLYIPTMKISMYLAVSQYCNLLRALYTFTLPLSRQFPLLGILKSPLGSCLKVQGVTLGHLQVLEGWAFLSKSVWIGPLEYGKHTGAGKRPFHPLPFTWPTLREGRRNCQHEESTCSMQLLSGEKWSVAGQQDKDTNNLLWVLFKWPDGISHKTGTRGESVVSLLERSRPPTERVQLMLWARGKELWFSNVSTFISTHSLVPVFFFSFNKQVWDSCSVPGIVLGAQGAKIK